MRSAGFGDPDRYDCEAEDEEGEDGEDAGPPRPLRIAVRKVLGRG